MNIDRNSQLWRYVSIYDANVEYLAENNKATLCSVVNSFLKTLTIHFFVGVTVFFSFIFGHLGIAMAVLLMMMAVWSEISEVYYRRRDKRSRTKQPSLLRAYIRSKLDRYCIPISLS